MRLLPKSEMAQRKNDARKQEIDEGIRIAKRVDAVRETLLNEEQSLEKFRRETVALIHQQIIDERKVLKSLQAKVKNLTVKREQLLIPLDKEWAEIQQVKEQIESEQKEIEKSWLAISKQEKTYNKLIQEATDSLVKTLQYEEYSRTNLKEVSDMNIIARQDAEESQKIKERTYALHDAMVKELKQRDSQLASRERDCILKESKLLEKESALENGWKLLEDRKAMFERTINRLK